MPSSYSTNLRLELMAANENLNTWGPIASTQWVLIEDALSGHQTIAMGDANYTLTTANGADDESRAMFLLLTGAHTAVRTLNLPAYAKTYIIRNATTGGFAVRVNRAGDFHDIEAGDEMLYYCDGTVLYTVGYGRGEIRTTIAGGTLDVATPNLLLSDNGTEALPAIAWSVDTDTGFWRPTADTMAFSAGGIERARWATEYYHIGTTTLISPESDSLVGLSFGGSGSIVASRATSPPLWLKRGTNNGEIVIFDRGTTRVGNISVTTTATTYNTSSDYRLKKDVKPLKGVGEKIDKIRPVFFRWKANDEDAIGFIAHELQEVVPSAVTGEKDGDSMQGVDASKIIPLLVAEIQSLRRRVSDLENTLMPLG